MCEYYGISVTLVYLSLKGAVGRDCYNYKEDPQVRQCSTGCCGDKYEEFCCNATMQIVGSILGGLIVIGVVIGVAFYCYKKKSKRREVAARGPGLFGRIGLRPRPAQNVAAAPQNPTARRGQPFRVPTNRDSNPLGPNAYYNPTYNPQQPVPQDQNLGVAYPYDGRNQAVYPPTAPMPPAYDSNLAPPPYTMPANKNGQYMPPPDYNTVIGHMNTPGYKPGEYNDNMPPPSH